MECILLQRRPYSATFTCIVLKEESWRVWLECNRVPVPLKSIVEACAMQANQSGDLANKASYLFSVRIRRLHALVSACSLPIRSS